MLALFALPASGAAALPPAPPEPRDHGNLLVGTIASVDTRAKSFVVRATDGKDTLLFWSSATGVTGGTLAGGLRVRVKWMKKQGKNWATSVEVIRQPARPQGRPVSRRSSDPSTCDEFFAASKIALPVHVAFMGRSLS
jgi:hypothetical protein